MRSILAAALFYFWASVQSTYTNNIPFSDWSLFACVCAFVFVFYKLHQCCAYWTHLPRCTLLMNCGFWWTRWQVEEAERKKKTFNDNSQNWPSPRYYYTRVSFVLFLFSFIHNFYSIHSCFSPFLLFFVHYVRPTKMANSIEK